MLELHSSSFKASHESWPIDPISERLPVFPGNTVLAWVPSLNDIKDSVRETMNRIVASDCHFIDVLVSQSPEVELFAVELLDSSHVFSSHPTGNEGVMVPLTVCSIMVEFMHVLASYSSLLRGVVGHPIRVTLDSELLCIPLKVCLRRSRVEGHRRGNGRRLAGGSRGS